MHRDTDFDLETTLPPQGQALMDDLGLDQLCTAMSGADNEAFVVARAALLLGLSGPEEIAYRQHVLADCLTHPAVVRELYALVLETLARQRKIHRGLFLSSTSAILRGSLESLHMLIEMLVRMRDLARANSGRFRSEGLATMFAMLARELDDAYITQVKADLAELEFRRGELMSVGLGTYLTGVGHTLRKPRVTAHPMLDRLLGTGLPSHGFRIAERDEAGGRILSELKARGLDKVANAVAQATDNILAFIACLRSEVGFYVGCLNLHDRLAAASLPTCRPQICPDPRGMVWARGLYDPGLCLSGAPAVIGNDIDAGDADIVVITGANQGGKSTFLRALGLSQLMAQAGMFVAADAYRAPVRTGVFTHFKRQEDASMTSGKLDEELHRMSEIADEVSPGAVILFNESFSSTNEREGSQIAREVIRALREAKVRIAFVTHQYDLAHGLQVAGDEHIVFLRAARAEDGGRPFRLLPGEPLSTSFGADLYAEIFGQTVARARADESHDALGVP
ncbi:MAG: hypothetical protein L0H25_02685 [Micrococcales bacterium]|nr:hypothetical protein [Micrococcales bacterium]